MPPKRYRPGRSYDVFYARQVDRNTFQVEVDVQWYSQPQFIRHPDVEEPTLGVSLESGMSGSKMTLFVMDVNRVYKCGRVLPAHTKQLIELISMRTSMIDNPHWDIVDCELKDDTDHDYVVPAYGEYVHGDERARLVLTFQVQY